MKKALKYLAGVIILALLIYVGRSIYLTANISATLPPIQSYRYDGAPELIVKDLMAYQASEKNLSVDVIDTLGDKQKRFGYEVIIKFVRKSDADTLRYHFKCVEDRPTNTTILKLIGAHNITNNTGGYGLNVQGMNILLKDFNTYLIDYLKTHDGLVLKEEK